MVDLAYPLQEDASVRVLTSKDAEALTVYRHSTAHLLAAAVTQLFPKAQCGIGPPTDEGDDIETVDLDDAFPPPVPAAAPPPAKDKGRITLVSGPKETDDLRRKISRPVLPELSLDDLDQDDDELDELSFESDAAVSPTPRVAPSPLDALRVDTLPPGSRAVSAVEVPAPALVSSVRRDPEINTVATTPVSVRLPGDNGQTDVSIPVEVTLGRGSAQVTIHLRLTLNLNLQQ